MRKTKVSFATRFNRPDVIPTNIGNGERSIFEERVVNGIKRLVVTGKEDFKAFIEASKEETLISNIMKRFVQGDTSVLSRVQGFYGDVTGMPSNLAESQQILINLENEFNRLPIDVRQKFDNSFDKFVHDSSKMSVNDFNSIFSQNSQQIKLNQEKNIVQNDDLKQSEVKVNE